MPGPGAVLAQEESAEADFEEEEEVIEWDEGEIEDRPRQPPPRPIPRTTDDLTGAYGRIGHIAFPTFGRDDSITNVELVPFIIDGNRMLFGDARFFLDNNGQIGGNGGLGIRRWAPSWDRVFGASLWYDYDDTSGNPFHQTGVSLETYGRYFDLRGNGYFPVSDSEQDVINRRANFRYQGNQVVFDHLRSFTESQTGFDMELGLPLPSDFARDHNVRVFGGYYHFFGDDLDDINGVRGRVEGSINSRIDLQVEYTDDDTFGTNVNFGVAFNFGTAPAYTPQADEKLKQLTRYVNRNYNIIVAHGDRNLYNQAAINPLTGQPYTVQHVSSSAAGSGSGTQADPFTTIAQAQTGNPDLILVHSGSVLSAPVVLAPNQRLLGEGISHLLNVQGVGNVALPAMTGGTDLPVLRAINGDALTLASGSEFAGFVIDAPTGNGIVGSGLSGATVRNVTIQNAGGEGILLANSSGSYLFENMRLSGIQGNALRISGGAPDVTLSGRIDNASNRIALIENTTGGTINLDNADLVDNGGTGILLANNAGTVSFGNVDIRNSTSTGIDIQGGTGQRTFTKDTILMNSAGPSINVENAQGRTDFNRVNITNTNGSQAIRSTNSATTTTFFTLNAATENAETIFARGGGEIGIFGGSLAATNAAAVDLENTNIAIDLTSLSSTNAANGVRIVNSIGNFIVRGSGTEGSGGTIQGANVGIFAENAGVLAFQGVILDGNGTGLMASNTDEIYFYSGQVINSTGHAFDLLNVQQFALSGSKIHGNGGTAVRGRFDAVEDYAYTLVGNTIASNSGSPIVLTTLPSGNSSTLSLDLSSNTINMTAAGSQALDLDWNGMLVSSIVGNTVTGSGASNAGFDITTTSTTELAQIGIGQNKLTFTGDGSTGTRITTSGASEIGVGQNEIVFNAANGVGAEFAIGQASTINIFDNAITDNISRGTGLLFSSITGTSSVTIDNNSIRLLSTDNLVDRGIIFNSVTGDVTLMGTRSNSISGATTPFSALGTTGQIIVNGVKVP